jgi:hypothetical protein
MDGSGSLVRLPEDIEREIVTAYCGLACLLPEALGRRSAYEACLAELDYIRHNVQTGDKITQRTLREWAERPVAKKSDDLLMWRLGEWERTRRPPPRNHAAFRGLATASLLVAFLILQNALSRC